MREYVVASGRIVPAVEVYRGPMLLRDANAWQEAFRIVRTRENARYTALYSVLLLIPTTILLVFADWEVGLAMLLIVIGLAALRMLPWTYWSVSLPLKHYRLSGLGPGLYTNGLELHAFMFGFRHGFLPFGRPVLAWRCTVFLPYTECLDLDMRYHPFITFFQDSVTVRLRGGRRLAFPAGLLGEDGLEMFRTLVARGPPRAEAPRLVLYGPAGEGGQWSEVRVPGATAPDRQRR